MNKLTSGLICIICLLGAVVMPLTASAYDFKVNGVFYKKLKEGSAVSVSAEYERRSDANKDAYKGSVVIPSSVTFGGKTYKVTSVGPAAFFGCTGLRSVELPGTVTAIGLFAFMNCENLTSITIPNSVTKISSYAFKGCKSLASVILPGSLASIGSSAFCDCEALRTIVFPETDVEIGDEAFRGTRWLDNQPLGPVYAGRIFYKYKGIMPQSTSVIIKEGTLGIANSAFVSCRGLISVSIPNSVKYIGGYAFSGCRKLRTVSVPNSVGKIGSNAFFACVEMRSITIGESVMTIDSGAFCQCSSLQSITSLSVIPPKASTERNSLFYLVPASCRLNVPAESISAYRDAPGWNYFTSISGI